MLLIFLIHSFLFSSNIITLQERYCVSEPYLSMHDVDKNSQDFQILLSIPQNSTAFKVPSIKIVALLEESGYEVKDESGGVISIEQNCHDNFDYKLIYEEVVRTFQEAYPTIKIESLHVKPANHLPPNFKTLAFTHISLLVSKLKTDKGTFLAHFNNIHGVQKSIYFRFDMEAQVKVFSTVQDIAKGQVVGLENMQERYMELEKLPTNPLLKLKSSQMVAKFYIKKDTILTKNHLRSKPTIQKGALIYGIFKDGSLSLRMEVQALKSGYVGDIIRVRAASGKVFNGVIVNEKKVLLR